MVECLLHDSAVRAVIQRVREASVSVDGEKISSVGKGLMVLLGVEEGDSVQDLEWLSQKVVQMRIFADENGKMNRSLLNVAGEALVVSQFTLHGSTKKGNRPSFLRAARPEISQPLYEAFCEKVGSLLGRSVGQGVFGADMQVSLTNDGPITIVIDSRNPE